MSKRGAKKNLTLKSAARLMLARHLRAQKLSVNEFHESVYSSNLSTGRLRNLGLNVSASFAVLADSKAFSHTVSYSPFKKELDRYEFRWRSEETIYGDQAGISRDDARMMVDILGLEEAWNSLTEPWGGSLIIRQTLQYNQVGYSKLGRYYGV